MKSHLEIISDGIDSKHVLIITEIKLTDRPLFFLPKLLNIDVLESPGVLTISLGAKFSSDIFNTWLVNLCESFNTQPESEKIDHFNIELKKLIALGKKKKSLSIGQAMGLYSELLHLNALIENFGAQAALAAWNNPAPAIHDFELEGVCHEVKSIARAKNDIRISSIDQLTTLDSKPLELHVYILNVTRKSAVDSIGVLYDKITSQLSAVLKSSFQQKCAESKHAPYLGPSYEKVEFQLSLIKRQTYYVDQLSFPRLHRDNIPSNITALKYSINLGSIANFLIDQDV